MVTISPRKILLWLVWNLCHFPGRNPQLRTKFRPRPEIDQNRQNLVTASPTNKDFRRSRKQTKSSYGLPDEQRLPKIPKMVEIEVLKTKISEDLPRLPKMPKMARNRRDPKNGHYKPQKNTAVAGMESVSFSRSKPLAQDKVSTTTRNRPKMAKMPKMARNRRDPKKRSL